MDNREEAAKRALIAAKQDLANAKEQLALAETEVSTALKRLEEPPEPPPPPPPPPQLVLFTEPFNTSPAPTNYADTATWVNDGEAVPVSGGVAHVDTNKVRLWTKQKFPSNVSVSATVTPKRWRESDSRFDTSWAGFKFYLRRQPSTQPTGSEPTGYEFFYTAEPLIHEGAVRIQKKYAFETYVTLAEVKVPKLVLGPSHTFKATIEGTNPVTIKTYIDGQLLLTGTDDGSKGGHTFVSGTNGSPYGWRSDALAYDIDDFTVTEP